MARTSSSGQPATGADFAEQQQIRESHASWLGVWTRAVIGPAWRRATAIWVGCAIVGAVVLGPTGMQPHDLTGLALHDIGVGLALAATWLLAFVPTLRIIVRAQPAMYLRSLPSARVPVILVGAAAIVVLQLPWLALWIAGEGMRGLLVVLAVTCAMLLLASWRPSPMRARFPAWRRPNEALRGIHMRALRRRAGDALVRGAGLAILAGGAGGLLVRNNHAVGESAGILAASLIAVVLVPAQVGPLLVLVGAHRESAWLARASGIAERTRTFALVYALLVVHLVATGIAVGVALLVAGRHPWIAILAPPLAIGTALVEARALLAGEDAPSIASRTVIGAIVAAAIAVICLVTLGTVGALADVAAGLLAIGTLKR